MSPLVVIFIVVVLAAILVVSHSVAWLRGFDAGKTSAGFDALAERVAALKREPVNKESE